MIHFSLNRNNKQSLVDQIYQQMADRIASGQLEHGTRLPSVRDLSRRLNVAFVTVTKAYERLEQDGYIEKVHGKGTFVRREGIKQAGRPENDAYGWQLSVTDYLPRAQAVRPF